MKEIIFILLVVFTQDTQNPNNVFDIKNDSYTDVWYSTKYEGTNSGIALTPNGKKHHYKAVIFYDSVSVNRYLQLNNFDKSILIDCKKGKQYIINSMPIKEKQTYTREEIIGYNIKFKNIDKNK